MVIDIFLIFYSFYCLVNEVMQFRTSGFSDYFKSIWNYFDIALIPLMMASSGLNLSITFMITDSEDSKILVYKIIFALCMFCFCFRFISFCRAFKNTSYMIRLIFNVLISVRYFVLFIVLFIFSLASTYFVLHNTNNQILPSPDDETEVLPFTFWSSFYDFYLATLGDSSGIVEDGIIESDVITRIFDIGTSFIFSIILMNLLVAIVWDKYADIQCQEEVTRNYELMNIINDLTSSITYKIVKGINKIVHPNRKFPKYLLYLCNENDISQKNQINDLEGLGKDIGWKLKGIEDKVSGKVEKIHIENQSISERLEEVEKIIKENSESLRKIADFLKTGGKNTENVINEIMTKYISEQIKK